MANKFPYVPSAGPLVKTINHLRRSFPKEVTAETLRKLGVAPKNESYVINVLRFLGVIDDEGKKVDDKALAFLQHQDDAFAGEFAKVVEEAYEELIDLHGEAAWKLDRGALTQFFRTTDHSSDVVGSRQAGTFSALAALSGHGDLRAPKSQGSPKRGRTKKSGSAGADAPRSQKATKPKAQEKRAENTGASRAEPPVGLTVRIEVNLPATGDQATYDRIFQSIRKYLIDGS